MRILGIESTAHTFGVGIYDSELDKMLANPKAFYKAPAAMGMIPVVVAEHHKEHGPQIIEQAMEQSASDWGSIDAISYSAGPGLGPCLQIGANAASRLAGKYGKPLIPVHHGHAHIEAARWQTKFKDPLVLYVSGGNTQIVIGTKTKSSFGPPFVVLGETLDIGVGNLFDAFARELGLEFAHGSVVAKMAGAGKNYHELPYTVKGMNFAFSGLLTYAAKQVGKVDANDLCFSLMETAFAELCEASERALLMSGKSEVVVCGGVAQNAVLMQKMGQMAQSHGAKCGTCENQYNADNGGMIALLGARELERKGKKAAIEPKKVWYEQKWRIDQIK
ncbi:MAG: tRNA (adenosine(37)-N6)-threonylcarbamoyltransferase complex transferase subunit TsaD [Candidatus Marsarchaeota archaeon]|nr:tRNA (adenosine(37)-N6)-threonylcarbamoyltransferase complex transferase subunit TsaD [Candidatus Marsarchaeota archaeon]